MRPNRPGKRCSVCVVLFSLGCSTPFGHTPDEKLEAFFKTHQAQFEVLLAEVQADTQLTTVQRKTLIYGGRMARIEGADLSKIEHLGMSRDRWMHYQKALKDLQLYGVMKAQSSVEFRVDAGTMLNGDSYKGFEYSRTKPVSLRHSLDTYMPARDGDESRAWKAFKPLTKDWYLYLLVNQ